MAPIPKQTTWTISFIHFNNNYALQKIKRADPLSNSPCTASSRTCEKKKQATLQNAACFPQLTKQFVTISCCGPSMRDHPRPLRRINAKLVAPFLPDPGPKGCSCLLLRPQSPQPKHRAELNPCGYLAYMLRRASFVNPYLWSKGKAPFQYPEIKNQEQTDRCATSSFSRQNYYSHQ